MALQDASAALSGGGGLVAHAVVSHAAASELIGAGGMARVPAAILPANDDAWGRLALLQLLVRLVCQDCHAVGYYPPDGGKYAYGKPVHEPLTDDRLRQHLAGFDIDNKKGAPLERVAAAALRIIPAGKALGINLFPAVSGSGTGSHLWCYWDKPQSAADVRAHMRKVLEQAGFTLANDNCTVADDDGIFVELFPRQDNVPAGGHSSLIALPFGRQSVPLDKDMQPIPEPLPWPSSTSVPPALGDETDESEPDAISQGYPVNVALLREALTYIPAKFYPVWIKFGHALKHDLGDDGFPLWDEWSQTCPEKYAEVKDIRAVWDNLGESPRAKPVTCATIFWLARKAGWHDDVLSPAAPLVSARQFIAKRYRQDEHQILFCYNDDFYGYGGSQYTQLPDDTLRSEVYAFLDKAKTPGPKGAMLPFNPTTKKVNDAVDALKAEAHLSPLIRTPYWLPNANRDADSAADLIAVANGLLHLPTMTLWPHTPLFFNLMALDFDFDPDATCPQWHAFLKQLWPEDAEAIDCLQEVFGYILSGSTKQHKIFLLIGPPRSGKGTIARVLTGLMGAANVAGPTLNSLSVQFGLQPLIGKALAIVSDARVGGSSRDRQTIVERLLSISGEDRLTIDRKYKTAWTGPLAARFLIISNELPRLPDASGALASRYVPLPLTISFLGREDIKLTDKLMGELPGIFNWAIEGWRRLQQRGHFKLARSAMAMLRQVERLSSTVRAFLDDCCVVEQGAMVDKDVLFNQYSAWCQGQSIGHPGTKETFATNLRAVLPTIKTIRPRGAAARKRCWVGLRLLKTGEEPAAEPDET
jgi:putative DNA primase/helicase